MFSEFFIRQDSYIVCVQEGCFSSLPTPLLHPSFSRNESSMVSHFLGSIPARGVDVCVEINWGKHAAFSYFIVFSCLICTLFPFCMLVVLTHARKPSDSVLSRGVTPMGMQEINTENSVANEVFEENCFIFIVILKTPDSQMAMVYPVLHSLQTE